MTSTQTATSVAITRISLYNACYLYELPDEMRVIRLGLLSDILKSVIGGI